MFKQVFNTFHHMKLRCLSTKIFTGGRFLGSLCKPNGLSLNVLLKTVPQCNVEDTISEYCVFITVSMSILRNPTSVWRQVLRRCGPCELSRFCSWLTSCRCLLIGSSSRSGPSVYKVAAPGFYPGSRVGRGPGRGSAADNPHPDTTSLSCEEMNMHA